MELVGTLLLISITAIGTCGTALWLDSTENIRRLRREYRRGRRAEERRQR